MTGKAGVRRVLFGGLSSREAVFVSVLFATLIGGGTSFFFTDVQPSQPHRQPHTVAVPMQRQPGGLFTVPVELNRAITIDFAVDSGASDVTIPLDLFWRLKDAGTISAADMRASVTYTFANGDRASQARFVIHRLTIGGVTLADVPATVSPTQGGRLLGQSALARFKSWQIDNANHVLWLVY